MTPLERLRHHVTGAIERGEKEAIVEKPAMGPEDWCDGCGCNPCDCANNHLYGGDPGDYPPPCTDPKGHEWACSGTAYGGDDESYHGEGRCYCLHCGADGDA